MREKILLALAVLTHPIFVPLLMAWFLVGHHSTDSLLIVAGATVVLPALILKLLGVGFKDPDLKERQIIYLVLALAYLSLLVYSYGYMTDLFGWFLTLTYAMIVFILISFKWKVSWHALGWGLMVWPLFHEHTLFRIAGMEVSLWWPLILIGVLVMWVRYAQKAHSLKELLLGYGLGVFLPYLYLICIDILDYGF